MSPNADPPGADPITQFSAVSKDYAKFRPRYPRALFEWIRSIVDRHALAWDCATGSGQAAVGLADDFAHVEATDANPEQLRHATPHPRITYRQALADRSGLADGTVDVVTRCAGAALAAVRRVLRRGAARAASGRRARRVGLSPAWCRHRLDRSRDDALSRRRRRAVLASRAAARRQQAAHGAVSIPRDRGAAVRDPHTRWRSRRSATFSGRSRRLERYRHVVGSDPVPEFESSVVEAWGGRDTVREVVFPMFVRAGRP